MNYSNLFLCHSRNTTQKVHVNFMQTEDQPTDFQTCFYRNDYQSAVYNNRKQKTALLSS